MGHVADVPRGLRGLRYVAQEVRYRRTTHIATDRDRTSHPGRPELPWPRGEASADCQSIFAGLAMTGGCIRRASTPCRIRRRPRLERRRRNVCFSTAATATAASGRACSPHNSGYGSFESVTGSCSIFGVLLLPRLDERPQRLSDSLAWHVSDSSSSSQT